ncbi:hypothetical protein HRbin11_00251 [bacterium HR11]|nr:hypothetical protein HRbin11_00251 [bacterium HR11]
MTAQQSGGPGVPGGRPPQMRPKPAPRPGGGYPAIGGPQFGFNSLVRQAIETRKAVILELMTGETLQVTLLREDQFTLTVLLKDEIRIVYKHGIKQLIFTKE